MSRVSSDILWMLLTSLSIVTFLVQPEEGPRWFSVLLLLQTSKHFRCGAPDWVQPSPRHIPSDTSKFHRSSPITPYIQRYRQNKARMSKLGSVIEKLRAGDRWSIVWVAAPCMESVE